MPRLLSMEMNKNAEILNHLYGVLMELNAGRSDDDVLSGIDLDTDEFLQRQLRHVKLLTSRARAISQKARFHKLLEKLQSIKSMGEEGLSKFLSPQQTNEFIPLFRKFKELSKEDEESIIEDAQFLQLLDLLENDEDENATG